MISSIVLKGCYNIGINNKKVKINDNILSIEKEIPFVRYRFEKYEESEVSYIQEMMNSFEYSTHLAEIKLDANTNNVLNMLNSTVGLDNIAKYIYISIDDSIVDMCAVPAEVSSMLVNVTSTYGIDRVMLIDKSTKLDTISAKKIIKNLEQLTGLTYDRFGICSSPLSFDDWACLTAVRARDLMAIYSKYADVALPSANHQCMNCCGCIRYMVVEQDCEAPADAKQKKAPKTPKAEGEKTTEHKPKKSKASFDPFAMLS